MNYVRLVLGTIAGVAFAATASAQTVGIGATKTGAVAQITAQISKAVSENADGVQMRTQTMGGTQQYIPVVNAGELDFAISNLPQYWMALKGTGLSEGNKYENLRLVTTMMKFSIGLMIPANLDVKTVADMKGKRLPHGFKAAPLFHHVVAGSLASAGLSYDDVERIPAVGLAQSWRMMMEDKIDGVIVAAGTGFAQQMNAKISGGIRYLSYDNTPEALAGMHKYFPKTYWSVVQPAKGLVGVKEPTTLITYDYLLWTHKGMSDEVVYKVTKVMHKNAADLKAGGPLWRTYEDGPRLAKNHDEAGYHPAAVKYYKEAGLWPNS